jgi:hypothetical protein
MTNGRRRQFSRASLQGEVGRAVLSPTRPWSLTGGNAPGEAVR